jgi:uncharacterized protein YfaS (alpha-2-macroglobulin family)
MTQEIQPRLRSLIQCLEALKCPGPIGAPMQMIQSLFHFASSLAFALSSSLVVLLTTGLVTGQNSGQDHDWFSLADLGDEAYEEGSFQKAFLLYSQSLEIAKETDDTAWPEFRKADAHLRFLDSSNRSDRSEIDAALTTLRSFFDANLEPDKRTRIWALAGESIGDHFHQIRHTWGFGNALQPYTYAMDFWAGSSDIEVARNNWLRILWKMAWPAWGDGIGQYGERNNWLPLDRLEQALTIANTDQDRARILFLIARSAQNQGDGPWWDRRMMQAFDTLKAMGTETGFYDASLWFEALWLEGTGPWQRNEDGQAGRKVQPARALELFKILADDKAWINSAYRKGAKQHIKNILAKELSVHVNGAFLTGSKSGYVLQTRNLTSIDCTLTPFDLTENVGLDTRTEHAHQWLAEIQVSGKDPVQRWTVTMEEDSPHAPNYMELALDGTLAVGAYLLEVRSGSRKDRALVLVTETALILKSSGQDLHAWVTNAITGKPLPGQQVHARVRVRDSRGRGFWRQVQGTTGADGLAHLVAPQTHDYREAFVAVQTETGSAFAVLSQHDFKPGNAWRVHVVTDRPAYRPDQTVSWKLSARRHTGLQYSTPSGHALVAKLIGPRGGEIDSAEVTLNDFGSAFGTFETGQDMALGQYRLQLIDPKAPDGQTQIASAALFRLEEYKRPEFEVKVSTPMDEASAGMEARPQVFVLGDEVQAEVQAMTYFGSPVVGAKVEAVLYKEHFAPKIMHRSRFQWFSDSLVPDWQRQGRYRHNNREEVLRKELTTDALGRAQLTFATPFGQGQGFKYTVEARVTDASRREVTGIGSVLVQRQSYRVELDLEHTIVPPGGKAELSVLAQDSNGNAVSVAGQLFLYRGRWVEVWTGPDNKPIDSSVLRKARQSTAFPVPGWTRVRAEYVFEAMDGIKLSTSAEGKANWSPTLAKEGVYKFTWVSQDPRSSEVNAEVWMFAADGESMELAYNQEGLQILLDKSTIAEGQIAQVLILSDASDRHVLFTVEAETLMSIEVLHLEGSVKLVSIPLDVTHVPNVFLTANEIRNGALRTARERLVVPPAKHFLDLNVTLDRESYEPGAAGTFQVQVLDSNGDPVRSEVSLALFDGSLLGIAQDLIPDPREFFWGHDRSQRVTQASCFDQLQYVRLVEDDLGRLMTPDELQRYNSNRPIFNIKHDGSLIVRKEKLYRGPGDTMPPGAGAPSMRSFSTGGRVSDPASMELAEAAPQKSRAMADDTLQMEGGDQPAEGPRGTISVRADFRETALWLPTLVTDEQGQASGEFTLPDGTTRWQISSFANDGGDRFGSHREQGAVTELPLILRPQIPRFLVEGDEARVSALLTNTTDSIIKCQVAMEAEGLQILGYFDGDTLRTGTTAALTVPAMGDARLDFLVRPLAIGKASVKLSARAGSTSDAVLRHLPVIEHGIEALVSASGRLDGSKLEHDFVLPPAKEGRTSMQVSVAPSLATTMLDALPYLTHYPYGCLEQSLSRFVPTAVTARTLQQMGLDPNFVARASFGGIEEEFTDKTQPRGSEDFEEFTLAAEAGLAKIEAVQKSDGSWAWWPRGPSNRWMTAYAAWSLALAKDAQLDVSSQVLDQAMDWLERALVEETTDVNMKAWMLHALCEVRRVQKPEGPSANSQAAFAKLYTQRVGLSPYGRALLTLCAKALGKNDEARILVDNLANGVVWGDASGSNISNTSGGSALKTTHWGSEGIYRRWSQGAVESTAFTLRALLAVDPKHELVAPTMSWLVKNRRGSQWKSTRDTAICVLAMCDYLKATGEASQAVGFKIWVDDELIGERNLEGQALLVAHKPFDIPGATSGSHKIVIERTSGEGPLYWTASARFFSAEEPIQARASEIFVRRDYFRLVPHDTLLKGKVFERVLLKDGDAVQSGERIEVVLTLDAKHDMEYMMIRDAKPAGLEATVLQSGGGKQARQLRSDEVDKRFGEGSEDNANHRATGDAILKPHKGYTGRSQWLYHELRDEAQLFFADKLPTGIWEIRSTLRAEVPGTFHALPAVATAMYVPEIQGNSAEIRVQVND